VKKLVFLTTAGIVFLTNVYAARPFSTDDADTVDLGAVEIEYGYEYVDGDEKENNHALVFTAGILDNLDLALEVPYQFINRADDDGQTKSKSSGFSDIILITKLSIIRDQGTFPDTALSFAYKTESGNDEKSLGTGRPEYIITGIFSKEWESLALHANLGYSLKKEFEDTFNYNFLIEYPLNEKITLGGEIFGDTVFSGKFNDNAASGRVGFYYAINDRLVFDAGAAWGISKAEPDYSITSGFTFSFGG
jgi:hypothetical protein